MQQYTINVVVKHEYPAGMEGGAAPRKTLREEAEAAKGDAPQANTAKVDTKPQSKSDKKDNQELKDLIKIGQAVTGGAKIKIPDTSVKPMSPVDPDGNVGNNGSIASKVVRLWNNQKFRTVARTSGFGGMFRLANISGAQPIAGALAGTVAWGAAGMSGGIMVAGYWAASVVSFAAGIGKLQNEYYYERKDWNADHRMAQMNYEYKKEQMAKGWYNQYSLDWQLLSWPAGIANSLSAYVGNFFAGVTGIDNPLQRAVMEGAYGTKAQMQSRLMELKGTVSPELSTKTPSSIFSAAGFSGDIAASTINGASIENLQIQINNITGN